MNREKYRPICEFPGYWVGEDGSVLSFKTKEPRLLKAGIDPNGYLKVKLCREGRAHTKYVAHLVAHAFLGPRPSGHEVCHCNGVYTDNRVTNLRYDTPEGNRRDIDLHGKRCRGEQCKQSKLTAEQVREIRSAYAAGGISQPKLAKQYGVDQASICRLIQRKIWAAVD